MKKKLVAGLKWGWIVAVTAFIAVYFYRNQAELLNALQHIRPGFLGMAFVSIFLAKILLAVFMSYTLRSIGRNLNYATCFRIYHISQLGKYIPGNIWHFVGKALAYQHAGFTTTEIKHALIVENIWLVSSALIYGGLVLALVGYDLMGPLLARYHGYLGAGILVAVLAMLVMRRLVQLDVRRVFGNLRISLPIMLLLLLIWTLLGLGFAMPAIPFLAETSRLMVIPGLYAIAYSVGFVTPFAPAGIGVREGILAVGLLPQLSLEIILLISATNRLIYLLVEILLALLSNIGRWNLDKQ